MKAWSLREYGEDVVEIIEAVERCVVQHAIEASVQDLVGALAIFQFPVFIVAGAIGDTIGDETVTDGLGMLLTGALLVGSSVAVWLSAAQTRDPPIRSEQKMD